MKKKEESLSSLPRNKSEKENSFDYFDTDDTVEVSLNKRYFGGLIFVVPLNHLLRFTTSVLLLQKSW